MHFGPAAVQARVDVRSVCTILSLKPDTNVWAIIIEQPMNSTLFYVQVDDTEVPNTQTQLG